MEVVNSQYQPPQDTSTPLSTHNTARIVEIPVEVRLHLDSKHEAVQAGLFESPKKIANEHIGVGEHMQEERFVAVIREIPVVIQQHAF